MKMHHSKTYLLLHGAWHGSWCWQYITPLLQAQGHTVIAPDLPGHGKASRAFTRITLKSYTDAVTEIAATCRHPVTLVGHSMAGTVISQVAERCPHLIDELIFVAAFIPAHQQSLLQQAQESKTSGISSQMKVDSENNSIELKSSPLLKALFFNACPSADAEFAFSQLQPEPFQPFLDPVHLTEAWGGVRKKYIICMKDKVLRPEDQQRICKQAGCKSVVILEADHSPFFSTPKELVQGMEYRDAYFQTNAGTLVMGARL